MSKKAMRMDKTTQGNAVLLMPIENARFCKEQIEAHRAALTDLHQQYEEIRNSLTLWERKHAIAVDKTQEEVREANRPNPSRY